MRKLARSSSATNCGTSQAAKLKSTFSTHSGMKAALREDQPGAVAAASLIEWSRNFRSFGWMCGSAEAAQNAAGSQGRAAALIRRS